MKWSIIVYLDSIFTEHELSYRDGGLITPKISLSKSFQIAHVFGLDRINQSAGKSYSG